jgi:hypothetical protein
MSSLFVHYIYSEGVSFSWSSAAAGWQFVEAAVAVDLIDCLRFCENFKSSLWATRGKSPRN